MGTPKRLKLQRADHQREAFFFPSDHIYLYSDSKVYGNIPASGCHCYAFGRQITSSQTSIQVVSDGASSSHSSGQGGNSSGDGQRSSSASGEISSSDLFLRLSLSRTEVVIGEPITATLKIYQRVNVVQFENAKLPTFNGFWSQETYVPTSIEFKRESLDDRIYQTAVLRSYVLIPQQSGTITIDPSELVCVVSVRNNAPTSNSLFDRFFRMTTVPFAKGSQLHLSKSR